MLDLLLGVVAPLLEYLGMATGLSTDKGSEGLGFLALAEHEQRKKPVPRELWPGERGNEQEERQ